MKKILFALFLMTFALPAYADEAATTGLKIAVVDVQQLMNNSKAAQSIQEQGKNLMKKYEKDMAKLEENLKASEKKVIDAQKEKNEEEFKKQFKSFQGELKESQKKAQELRVNNDKAVAEALNILRDEIVQIVDKMTVENGYDLVITRNDVVTVSRDIDITAEVMKLLDKKLTTVKVRS